MSWVELDLSCLANNNFAVLSVSPLIINVSYFISEGDNACLKAGISFLSRVRTGE